MKQAIAIIFICFFLSSSFISISKSIAETCQPKTTNNPNDSAWSMMCHDLHHTGRSQYSTANNNGAVLWRFKTELIEGGAIVGSDNVIYFGTLNGYLYALYLDGSLKWKLKCGSMFSDISSTPAINNQGVIYVSNWDNYLYAINSNGTVRWSALLNGTLTSSPAISSDGTIYLGTFDDWDHGGGYITAVNSDGSIKWTYETGYFISSSPAIADDGTIYIGSSDTHLYAMYPNGTLRWRFKTDDYIKSPPSIADDGTIYVGSHDGHLYALSPENGDLLWKCTIEGTETNPSIGPDGTIYVGGNELYAINPDGTIKWTYSLDEDHYIHKSSPAVSADGTIYFGTCSRSGTTGDIIALKSDGTLLWRWKIADQGIQSSPCIGPDGIIYIGTINKKFENGTWEDFGYLYSFGQGMMNPPNPPTIEGPSSGRIDGDYKCIIYTTDPEGYDIYYYIDWGDDSNPKWTYSSYKSGEAITPVHNYPNHYAKYTIRAKAKNEFGLESDWGFLEITMPKSKTFSIFDLLIERWSFFRFFNLK